MIFGTDTIEVKLKKEIIKVKDEHLDRVLESLSKESIVQRFSSHKGFNLVHEKDKITNKHNKTEHRFYVEPINFVTVYYVA